MTTIQQSITIQATQEAVFLFHTNPENLAKITPPYITVGLDKWSEPGLGQEVHLSLRQWILPAQRIHIRFVEYDFPRRLTDEQVRGPFHSMRQTREFIADGTMTIMTDTFTYSLPFGMLGALIDMLIVRHVTKAMFRYRQKKTKQLLEQNIQSR